MTITGHRYEQWGITFQGWGRERCRLWSWTAVRLTPRSPRTGPVVASSAGRRIESKGDAFEDATFAIDVIEAREKARAK